MQPLEAPVNTYVVVTTGLAVTLEIVLELKPVVGSQEYDVAPLPAKLIDSPGQSTVSKAVIETFGGALTLKVDE